jgi:hypothetical protein
MRVRKALCLASTLASDGALTSRKSGDGTTGDGPLELGLTASQSKPNGARSLRRARPRRGLHLDDPGRRRQ